MALKDGKECGKPVSTEAKACPHCGAEQPKPTSRLTILVAGLAIIGTLQVVSNQSSTSGQPSPKAAPTAAELQSEREFQQVVFTAKKLKGAMKNPSAFELVSAQMMQGPALCMTYRSTNSFNAVITERYVVTEKVSSASGDTWNKHCAGKTGTDYTHARRAI